MKQAEEYRVTRKTTCARCHGPILKGDMAVNRPSAYVSMHARCWNNMQAPRHATIIEGSYWVPSRFAASPDKAGWDRVMVVDATTTTILIRHATHGMTAFGPESFLSTFAQVA